MRMDPAFRDKMAGDEVRAVRGERKGQHGIVTGFSDKRGIPEIQVNWKPVRGGQLTSRRVQEPLPPVSWYPAADLEVC